MDDTGTMHCDADTATLTADDDTLIALSRCSTTEAGASTAHLGTTLPALKGIIDSHILSVPPDQLTESCTSANLRLSFQERHHSQRPAPLSTAGLDEGGGLRRLSLNRSMDQIDATAKPPPHPHPSPSANPLGKEAALPPPPRSPGGSGGVKSPLTTASRENGEDDATTSQDLHDEDGADGDAIHDQLLYQWKCPKCTGLTDLQVMLERSAIHHHTHDKPHERTHPYGNEEEVDFGEDGYVTEGDSEPIPLIGEVGFEPTTFFDKAWLSVEITDTHYPPYTKAATTFVGVGLVFVLVSVVVFIVESLPMYHEDPPVELFIIESVCVGYFTMELLVRLVFCPSLVKYLKEAFTVIDILSILPYYLTLAIGKTATSGVPMIRILRLMKVFRVLKVTKYNEAVHVVFGSLQKSTEGLYLLLFLILISTILFSSAIYFVEREFSYYDDATERWYTGPPEDPYRRLTPFQSITHAFWWALVTLTTVGYGNDVPFSAAGKAVAVVTMLCGTLVIAFPMLIIGQNFQEMYSAYRRKQKGKKKRLQRFKDKKHGLSPASVRRRRDDASDLASPRQAPDRHHSTGGAVPHAHSTHHHASPRRATVHKLSNTVMRSRGGSMVSRTSLEDARRQRQTSVTASRVSGSAGSPAGSAAPSMPVPSPLAGASEPMGSVPPFAFDQPLAVSSGANRTAQQLRALEDRLAGLVRTLDAYVWFSSCKRRFFFFLYCVFALSSSWHRTVGQREVPVLITSLSFFFSFLGGIFISYTGVRCGHGDNPPPIRRCHICLIVRPHSSAPLSLCRSCRGVLGTRCIYGLTLFHLHRRPHQNCGKFCTPKHPQRPPKGAPCCWELVLMFDHLHNRHSSESNAVWLVCVIKGECKPV